MTLCHFTTASTCTVGGTCISESILSVHTCIHVLVKTTHARKFMFISTESMADKCTVIHNVHFVSFVTIVDCSIAGYTSTTWAQVMLVVYVLVSFVLCLQYFTCCYNCLCIKSSTLFVCRSTLFHFTIAIAG